MKKIFFAATVIFFAAFSVASAKIPAEAVAVGGLSPYSAMSYVEGVYGPPAYSTMTENGEWLYVYGNSVVIFFSTEYKLNKIFKGVEDGSKDLFLLRRVEAKKFSGMATPAGIAPDMDEAVLEKTYGKPDVRVIGINDYDARWMYVGESEGEGLCFMAFDIKNGKISKISCYATSH